MFEEMRSGSASSHLSSFSMRIRHPNDWMEIRFVLWLLQDEIEYIQQDTTENREVEEIIPGQESPATRLSSITEKPSEMTEEALFRHDEPKWEQYDSSAASACLQCAKDGCEQTASVTDDLCESAWLHVHDSHNLTADTLDTHAPLYNAGLLDLKEEEPLELYYTSDMSKLAYRANGRDRQVEVEHPSSGEHLCISVYPVTATAQAVVKRDDALLTQDECKKHWSEVLVASKQELETWV